jgi:nitrogen-specific signal transduction histidine kinase
VTVVVTDDGPGLPDAVAENPLDPSVDMRADHGLGLAIVYRLVDRYDGSITIETPDTAGTRVEITLPRSEATPSTDTDQQVESPRPSSDLSERSPPEALGGQASETDG